MPDLLGWVTAVIAVVMTLVPVLWLGIIAVLRTKDRTNGIYQEIYGVHGNNGMKGKITALEQRLVKLIEDLPEEFMETRHYRSNEMSKEVADLYLTIARIEKAVDDLKLERRYPPARRIE